MSKVSKPLVTHHFMHGRPRRRRHKGLNGTHFTRHYWILNSRALLLINIFVSSDPVKMQFPFFPFFGWIITECLSAGYWLRDPHETDINPNANGGMCEHCQHAKHLIQPSKSFRRPFFAAKGATVNTLLRSVNETNTIFAPTSDIRAFLIFEWTWLKPKWIDQRRPISVTENRPTNFFCARSSLPQKAFQMERERERCGMCSAAVGDA